MGISWTAVYLCGEVTPLDGLPIEGEIEVRTLGKWTEFAPRGLQDPEPLAMALSSRVPGEVIAVQVQTNASVIGVAHIEQNRLVRRVEHVDGGWSRIEGAAPREWERELFSDALLQDAIEGGEDEAELRAAFASRQLKVGESLPRPNEFGTMLMALGVTEKDWDATRKSPPRQVVRGAKRSFGSLIALVVFVGAVIGAVLSSRDARGLFAALAAMSLVVSLMLGVMRKLRVGRWF
ncbi:MAG: hypothetical protein JNM17_23410, partial [Archangium sp.]|nr:hypothetical protein [Archangium sp.]